MSLENENLVKVEAALICHQVGGQFRPLRAKYVGELLLYELYQPWGADSHIAVSLGKGKVEALKTLVGALDRIYNEAFSSFEAHTNLNSLEGVV